ncbi:beta-ketoacyl synthase N-terminal-like domain-containing protein [Cytobacillus sp. FSL R7-0696]|uniref:beta-ketoacyl synthase N-terminal-like domain-containing protein n=1 Tax=Cytobacillus sp. FSL R7-0696 TaxID=2921691 RepID=UPI0030F90A1A
MGVVVTGMGLIGPNITSIKDFSNILKDKKTILNREEFNGVHIFTGRVNENDISHSYLKASKLPKSAQMLLHATDRAIEMAQIQPRDYAAAIIVGSSGGVITEVFNHSTKLNKGKRMSPYAIGNMNGHTLANCLSTSLQIEGPAFSLANSCTSSLDAIHMAKILLQANEVDVCIVGGVDSTINDLVLAGFLPLRILQTGETFMGPFSAGEGFAMSEGAGVLVLESEEVAVKRKKEIIGYLTESSMFQSAYSSYIADPGGRAMVKAVERTIKKGMPTYINSQALGSQANDDIEAMVYGEFFVDKGVPITSIKGNVGHAMGASGMFQVMAGLISIQEQFIPPTIRVDVGKYEQLLIVDEVIHGPVEQVLVTSQGYGGNNHAALFSKERMT